MDEKDETAPFPREPWQKLLEEATDGPSQTTDARIRAGARRDLAPRGRRWWLPASLAASFVLAVFIVQSQFGTVRVPAATESGGADGTIHARIIAREETDAARPAGEAPAARSKRAAAPRDAADADVFGYQESELAADSAGSGPRIGGPEHDVQAATEMPEAAIASELPAAPPASNAAAAPAEALDERAMSNVGRLYREALPHSATPEAWYAEIERLRTAGEHAEADRQLEHLKIVYPGWLEQHDEHLGKEQPR
jgi:hypothetical protein